MVGYPSITSPRKQRSAIKAWLTWARASRQTKHAGIEKQLSREMSAGRWTELRHLWQDWVACRDKNDLSLEDPWAAARIVNFLLNSGIPRQSIVFVVAKGASELPPSLRALRIASRPCSDRKGRAKHRLFFTKPGVSALDANAATVSVLGLNWWMLALGSALIAFDNNS